MNVAGLLFALAPAITARVKKPKPVEQFALDHWRKACGALEAENARLSARLARFMDENARLRAEIGVMLDRERARQDFFQNAQNRQLSQQAQQVHDHENWLQAQSGAHQGLNPQGLIGAHNPEHFCNCVPDRASFLSRE